jgi:hypothetical protein
MYRQSSHISRAKSFLPSPASDELTGPDSDITAILEKKRREIDEEIEVFNALKEKEFNTFEDELRSSRTRNPNTSAQRSISPKPELGKLHADSFTSKEKKKGLDEVTLGGLNLTPGPSKPSVSVDRVTINGMTTPPVFGTPPLGRTVSHSPQHLSITPPRISSVKESSKPPTRADRENDFHGLFTPGYLQLLDTQPASLPPKSTSPSVTHSKRSLTASALPSNSLPSALRSGSGTVRKRKHVTFRLAHSIVVDPSSSYEETPSPSDDQFEEDLNETEADLSAEILPNPSLKDRPMSDTNGSPTIANKSFDEGNFFSFEEDLEAAGENPHDDQDVSQSNKPL